MANVSITWREELVEDERNFYVKLSPDVRYTLTGVTAEKDALANRILLELQKAAKEVKVKR